MSRVWLASYPKSGNTWFRMLIAALSATDERPLDINDLAERTRMISGREAIDHATMIDSALLTHDEADVLRSRVYANAPHEFDATEPSPSPRFYKVHDAYTRTTDGEPVLGRHTAIGAVVLVRDPRDVAVSMAAHFNTEIDWTIAHMGRTDAAMGGMPDDRVSHFRQRLLTWGAHVASWLDQRDVPVHLVRYESLLVNPVDVFLEAMRFAGRDITRKQAHRAAELASFANLQTQERERGFAEGPRHGPFFRHGRCGGWRESLTTDQVQRIEELQGAMMARLGYERATDPPPHRRVEIPAIL